jgi:hypothetical protein
MDFETAISVFLIISALIVVLIMQTLKESTSGLKIMLLGINITLFGGIFAVSTRFNLAGMEYLIALLGLIISALGLWKKDKN